MSNNCQRTANLRLSIGEIIVAFEKPWNKLPNPRAQVGKAKCEKLTKINILHVAINYNRAMENLLANSIMVFGVPQPMLSQATIC